MTVNTTIRQTHRWLSVIFVAFVLANIVINTTGLGGEGLALGVGLTTLVPLIGLILTGIYMFVLPYLAGR